MLSSNLSNIEVKAEETHASSNLCNKIARFKLILLKRPVRYYWIWERGMEELNLFGSADRWCRLACSWHVLNRLVSPGSDMLWVCLPLWSAHTRRSGSKIVDRTDDVSTCFFVGPVARSVLRKMFSDSHMIIVPFPRPNMVHVKTGLFLCWLPSSASAHNWELTVFKVLIPSWWCSLRTDLLRHWIWSSLKLLDSGQPLNSFILNSELKAWYVPSLFSALREILVDPGLAQAQGWHRIFCTTVFFSWKNIELLVSNNFSENSSYPSLFVF